MGAVSGLPRVGSVLVFGKMVAMLCLSLGSRSSSDPSCVIALSL